VHLTIIKQRATRYEHVAQGKSWKIRSLSTFEITSFLIIGNWQCKSTTFAKVFFANPLQ